MGKVGGAVAGGKGSIVAHRLPPWSGPSGAMSPGHLCQHWEALTRSPGNAAAKGFIYHPPRPGQGGPCCTASATSTLLVPSVWG